MEPLVSVHIATYNQKDFIGKAIDSAISQQVSFPMEIVIGDDLSTDGTREVLLSYKEKYPEKIVLNLLLEKGKGMIGRENYETTMDLCKGKYIAFLDGDDYWKDDGKLEEQVKFLESNEDFVMCHHDCEAKMTEGVKLKKDFSKAHKETGFYEACQITIPFMSSVVIRRDALNYFNRRKWLENLDLGDFALWAMASLKGKAYYIDKEMAYYRVNANSVTKILGYEVQARNRIKFAEQLLDSEYKFDRGFINRFLCRYYFQYSGIYFSKRNPVGVFKYGFKSMLSYFKGMSLKSRNYKWIKRLKWGTLFKIYLANVSKSLKFS